MGDFILWPKPEETQVARLLFRLTVHRWRTSNSRSIKVEINKIWLSIILFEIFNLQESSFIISWGLDDLHLSRLFVGHCCSGQSCCSPFSSENNGLGFCHHPPDLISADLLYRSIHLFLSRDHTHQPRCTSFDSVSPSEAISTSGSESLCADKLDHEVDRTAALSISSGAASSSADIPISTALAISLGAELTAAKVFSHLHPALPMTLSTNPAWGPRRSHQQQTTL